jgi:hypothetical protein
MKHTTTQCDASHDHRTLNVLAGQLLMADDNELVDLGGIARDAGFSCVVQASPDAVWLLGYGAWLSREDVLAHRLLRELWRIREYVDMYEDDACFVHWIVAGNRMKRLLVTTHCTSQPPLVRIEAP